MKASLTKGLDKEDAERVKASFLQGLWFRKALVKNLRNKIEAWRKTSRSQTFILEGDFAQRVAWGMGYETAYEELIALLQDKDAK